MYINIDNFKDIGKELKIPEEGLAHFNMGFASGVLVIATMLTNMFDDDEATKDFIKAVKRNMEK